MKKIMPVVILFIMLLVSVTGCNQSVSPVVVEGHKPNKQDVLIEGMGVGELNQYYESIKDMTADSDAVVYGKVIEYQYYVDEGTIYTIETIRILESIYGELQKGENIQVFRQGGYALINDYINSYRSKGERTQQRNDGIFKECSDDDIQSKYIFQLTEGYIDIEINNQSVMFLQCRNPEKDLYETIGAWQGEYIELENGLFMHQNATIEAGTTVQQLSDIMIQDIDGGEDDSSLFTYEELLEQILD